MNHKKTKNENSNNTRLKGTKWKCEKEKENLIEKYLFKNKMSEE